MCFIRDIEITNKSNLNIQHKNYIDHTILLLNSNNKIFGIYSGFVYFNWTSFNTNKNSYFSQLTEYEKRYLVKNFIFNKLEFKYYASLAQDLIPYVIDIDYNIFSILE